MLPTNDADLTDEEFDELEQFLLHDSALDEPMSLSEIDGLLTAVVIGPVFPPPENASWPSPVPRSGNRAPKRSER